MPLRCHSDATQMPLRCHSHAIQMWIRCWSDADQMPIRCSQMSLRCHSDVTQMSLRCHSDATQMWAQMWLRCGSDVASEHKHVLVRCSQMSDVAPSDMSKRKLSSYGILRCAVCLSTLPLKTTSPAARGRLRIAWRLACPCLLSAQPLTLDPGMGLASCSTIEPRVLGK